MARLRLRPLLPAILGGVGIAVVVVAINILGAVAGNDIPGTGDEFSLLFQAEIFSRGTLTAEAPEPARFFASHYLQIHDGRWFSIYFPYHSLVLAIGLWLGSPLFLISIVAGLTLLVIYRLVAAVSGRRVAAVTVGMLALSPGFLFYSASYYNHTTALAWAALAALAVSRLHRTGGWRDALLAGVFTALLGFTRPAVGAVFAVALGAWVAHGIKRRRITLRPAAWMAGGLAGVGLCTLFYNFALVGTLWPLTYLAANSAIVGFTPSFTLLDGLSLRFADGLGAAAWLLGLPDRAGWSHALAAAFFLAGTGLAIRRRQSRGLALAGLAVVVGVAVAYLGVAVRGGRFGPRFFYETTFIWCWVAVLGFEPWLFSAKPLWRWSSRGAAALLVTFSFTVNLPTLIGRYQRQVELRMGPFLETERRGLSEAIVFLAEVPALDPTFYTRNDPELSGILYVLDQGCANRELLARHPGRSAFVYRWSADDPASRLTPIAAHPWRSCAAAQPADRPLPPEVDLLREATVSGVELVGLSRPESDGQRAWRWALGPGFTVTWPVPAGTSPRLIYAFRNPLVGQVVTVRSGAREIHSHGPLGPGRGGGWATVKGEVELVSPGPEASVSFSFSRWAEDGEHFAPGDPRPLAVELTRLEIRAEAEPAPAQP